MALMPGWKGRTLLSQIPTDGKSRIVGKKVILKSEMINGKRCFLGKYLDIGRGLKKNIRG